MSKARVVIAISDSALRQSGPTPALSPQLLQQFCSTIVKLSSKYEIVIVPSATTDLQPDLQAQSPQPLPYAIAMQQGSIGYQFVQALDNALAKSHKAQKSTSLTTRIVVDRRDPAFRTPSYALPQVYDSKTSLHLIKTAGWAMREDADGFHRLLPSPQPVDVIEAKPISALLETGSIIIALGCGGIPVIRTKVLKTLKGVEAVVTPERGAVKLAELIHADIFVSLIDLPHLYLYHRQPHQLPLGVINKRELSNFFSNNAFTDALIPQVQIALDFTKANRTTIITSPKNLELALARRAGTIVSLR